MAHEKLRFSFIINEDRSVENGGTKVALQQALYSDDYLGTHFGLFANFTGEKCQDQEGNTGFKCSKVTVRIQNYNGSITTGILKVLGIMPKEVDETLLIEGSTGKQYYMVVAIQGLNNNFEDDVPINFEFYDGDILETVVVHMPIDNKYSQIDEEDPDVSSRECLLIDENYQFRDGESIEWKPGAKPRLNAARLLNQNGLKNGMEAIKKLKTLKHDGFQSFGGTEEGDIFITIGGGRPCKMKIADIRIK
nr:hypothetical protein [Allomuricauda sp.]